MQLHLPFPRRTARRRARRSRWFPLLLVALPITAWWGQRQFKLWTRSPDAIVVLGGDQEREAFAARMAQDHGDLPVWVSSGTNPEYAEWLFFEEAGLPRDRVNLDYRAVDTVTNFTTLVPDLKAEGIDKIYLVTSDNHMRRARLIGEIVLGSNDIAFEPVAVPSSLAPEPVNKAVRDGARALLWTLTGYSGADLADFKHANLYNFTSIIRARSRS
ncbi:MAG: YdcF family protein [Synechococcales cyanobacterium RM1_1_8]|nr:YdcF family protein [Synechococcales cyanobacterium RM1_1_8]